jgi:hypothetical protein
LKVAGDCPPIDVIEVGPPRDSPALADGGMAIWHARASLWDARLRDHFANPLFCEEKDAARFRRDEDRETWAGDDVVRLAFVAIVGLRGERERTDRRVLRRASQEKDE